MKPISFFYRFSGAALIPVLAFAVGTGSYAQDRHDDRHDDNRYDQRHDDQRHDNDRYDHRNDRHDERGRDFRFDDNYRSRFSQHYRSDAYRWRNRHDRVRFVRGARIPVGYRIQPVPVTYYRGVPPPPPGYQYGYYEGYVVAYDPTTRVIGDVMDLVGAAMGQ